MRILIPVYLFITILLPGYLPAADNVTALTGARTKIVWQQHQGDGSDTHGSGTNFKLMGYDTDTGSEQVILGTVEGYTRPLITHDGSKVVFSDRGTKKAYVVNWNGTGKKEIAGGFASDVWKDPATGYEWAYLRTGSGTKDNPIVRYRLDDFSKSETVWNTTGEGHDLIPWFQLSEDGTHAGSCFPWSNCGMTQKPFTSWTKFGGGCWTSTAPDNSYMMWIFDGLHRNVDIYYSNGTRRAKVDIHTAPGIRGWEVYDPKWSNNVRFFTMVGPFTGGSTSTCASSDCGNKIGSGGTAVEVYIGKFNSAFTAVEAWVRVTSNSKGDFYPDVWIEPATGIGSRSPDRGLRIDPAAFPVGGLFDIQGRPVPLHGELPAGVYIKDGVRVILLK